MQQWLHEFRSAVLRSGCTGFALVVLPGDDGPGWYHADVVHDNPRIIATEMMRAAQLMLVEDDRRTHAMTHGQVGTA